MREFFFLAWDSNADHLAAVCDYDLGEFNPTVFWTGKRFDSPLPPAIKVWVGEGEAPDFLGNPLSWEIMSDRFWSTIEPLVRNGCEVFAAPLFDRASGAPISGYKLVNVIGTIKGTSARDRLETTVGNLVLEHDQIPSDAHFFRLQESPTMLIVSDVFVATIWEKRLKGIALIKCRSR